MKAPAFAPKVIALTPRGAPLVPHKSFVGFRRDIPAKTRSSLLAGAVPPLQLAPVDHLSSAPAPLQVFTAAIADAPASATSGIRTRRARRPVTAVMTGIQFKWELAFSACMLRPFCLMVGEMLSCIKFYVFVKSITIGCFVTFRAFL